MTYIYRMAGALALWDTAAAAQTAGEVRRIETPAAGVTVVLQGNADLDLQARLQAIRTRLAKVEEDAADPERAVAVLLLLGKPELTSLVRVNSRSANRGIQRAELNVYVSPQENGNLVGVVVELKNPRRDDPWKSDDTIEAVVKEPWTPPGEHKLQRSLLPIRAAAVRLPHPDAPGYKQRIALVFDAKEAGLDLGPVTVEVQRAGKWDFEFDLSAADLSSPTRSFPRALCQTDRCRLRRPGVRPALDAR